MRKNIHVSSHPLTRHKLSYLRQPKEITHFRDYENLIYEIGVILACEASATFKLTDIDTERTDDARQWLAGQCIDRKPVLVPIVRPGLLLADAVRFIISTPHMGHIGLYDDPMDGAVKEFMVTMPEELEGREFILLDMFVERGKTSRKAISILVDDYDIEPADISFISLIITEEGIREIYERDEFQEVKFFCAKVDSEGDRWLPSFNKTNERLFRTRNRDESFYEGFK